MTKPKAVLTVGVSASGKTTWATDFASSSDDQWVNINRDDLRAMIYESMHPTQKFSWQKWRWLWEDDVTAAQLETLYGGDIRQLVQALADTGRLSYAKMEGLARWLDARVAESPEYDYD